MCLDEENLCANFRPSHCQEVKNCTEKNMLMVSKLNLTNTLTHSTQPDSRNLLTHYSTTSAIRSMSEKFNVFFNI